LAVKLLHNKIVYSKAGDHAKPQPIHITALEIPVVYNQVLSIVPGLHAAPPVLPPAASEDPHFPPAPKAGYSVIIHVGVGREQPLRLERYGHKSGYQQPDHESQMADVVDANVSPPIRGFGKGYEEFDELLETDVDVDWLAQRLAGTGTPTIVSEDAGHYLCDFICYCSLAQAERQGRGIPTLFVHCPPVGKPLSSEEVAEGLEKIVVEICGSL